MRAMMIRLLALLGFLLMAQTQAATWDQSTGILRLTTVQFPVTQRAFANVSLLLKPDNRWILVGTSLSDFTRVPYNNWGVDSSYDEQTGVLTIPSLDMGWVKQANSTFTIHPDGWWAQGVTNTPTIPFLPISNPVSGTSTLVYNATIPLFNLATEDSIFDFTNPQTGQLESWMIQAPATTWKVDTTATTSLTVSNVNGVLIPVALVDTLSTLADGTIDPGDVWAISGFGSAGNVSNDVASKLGIKNPRVYYTKIGDIASAVLFDTKNQKIVPASYYTLDATTGAVTFAATVPRGTVSRSISVTYSYKVDVKFDAFSVDVAIYETASGYRMTMFGRNEVYSVKKLQVLERYATTLSRFTGGKAGQVVELMDRYGQLQLFQFTGTKTLTIVCVDADGTPLRADLPCYGEQPVTFFRTADGIFMRIDVRQPGQASLLNWFDSYPLNPYLQ